MKPDGSLEEGWATAEVDRSRSICLGNRTVLTNSTEPSVEEVFIEMRDQLTHIARRILRNPELAEEVVQDTYLRIAGGPRDRCVERPAAYCARAVRNMALDYLRKQEHENDYRVHGLDVELLEVPSGSSPEGIVFERQAIQLIHKVLEGVSPRAREAFELYRVKGATQRQIAVQMGCALGVVNALIAEACRAIDIHKVLLVTR